MICLGSSDKNFVESSSSLLCTEEGYCMKTLIIKQTFWNANRSDKKNHVCLKSKVYNSLEYYLFSLLPSVSTKNSALGMRHTCLLRTD